MTINKSPERNTFQKEGYLRRCEETGQEPSKEYLEFFETSKQQTEKLEASDKWKIDNLEYDLRSTKWICDKAKDSDRYAQNLYAAMCNMEFMKLDVMPILKDQRWSCSWRHAGGIVADMREEGDYIDWYCSGIGSGLGNGDEDGSKGYVPEGQVTEEIELDLKKLGWVPIEWEDE